MGSKVSKSVKTEGDEGTGQGLEADSSDESSVAEVYLAERENSAVIEEILPPPQRKKKGDKLQPLPTENVLKVKNSWRKIARFLARHRSRKDPLKLVEKSSAKDGDAEKCLGKEKDEDDVAIPGITSIQEVPGRVCKSEVVKKRRSFLWRWRVKKTFSEENGIKNMPKLGLEELYERNLRRFEMLLAVIKSTDSEETNGGTFLKKIATTKVSNGCQVDQEESKVISNLVQTVEETDANNNFPPADVNNNLPSSKTSLPRILSSSKTPVQPDLEFLAYIEQVVKSSPPKSMPSSSPTPAPPSTNQETTTSAGATTSAPAPINDANSAATETNKASTVPPPSTTPSKTVAETGSSSTSSTSSSASMTPPKSSRTRKTSFLRKGHGLRAAQVKQVPGVCNEQRKCGSCSYKGALPSAPPAYLDYGFGDCANPAGNAFKSRLKRDPVMERLKNVDVVEEMTYLVPSCDGGKPEEPSEECDFYEVDSNGDMKPLPAHIQETLREKQKASKASDNATPVTYSRRQRFNFKEKSSLDNPDSPPFVYSPEPCPGQSNCRCSCCLAGLRRDPECSCACCTTSGPARKCSSFDEMPVGKNPVIRKIPCLEEYCKKVRSHCTKLMPEASGMYHYDPSTIKFDRYVPRTPTPIVVEVEGPQPLTNKQLHNLGMEAARNRQAVRPPCPQQCEQEPLFLPPIVGNYETCCDPCNPCYCPPDPCCGNPEQTGSTQVSSKRRSSSPIKKKRGKSSTDYKTTYATSTQETPATTKTTYEQEEASEETVESSTTSESIPIS